MLKFLKTLLFLLIAIDILNAQIITDSIEMKELILLSQPLQIPIEEENRNIRIITKDEIQNSPSKTLHDLLQFENGIDLRQRGPFGTQADLSIDGGSFEQTLILINGSKIIDQQTAHNVLNLPIPLIAINRIEIIRGPAAKVLGINSLTGAINIITDNQNTNFINLQSHTGTNFKKDTSNNKNYLSHGIQLATGFSHSNMKHQLFLSHDKGNGFRYNTDYENTKIFFQSFWKINSNHKIHASYGYVSNDFGTNGFYAPPGDVNSSEKIKTTLVSLMATNKLSRNFSIHPSINYRYNYDDYRYFNHDSNKGRSRHYSNSLQTEIHALWQLEKVNFVIGVDYRNDEINSTNIHQHSRQNWGFYADLKSKRIKNWDFSLGSYANYNTQYGWEVFPGLDLSYKINENWKILTNIGTSQRIPSFTDLYLDQRPGNIGNLNLKSEKAIQTEIGLQFNHKNMSFNAYSFLRKIRDFIDWTKINMEDPWQAHNTGTLTTIGTNSSLKIFFSLNHNSSLTFQLDYSYLESHFSDSTLKNLSKYNLETLKHQLTQSIFWEYYKTSLNFFNRFNQRTNKHNYWLTDVRIQQRFNDKFSIFVDIQNLFNTSYSEIGSIPLPSRWLSFGTDIKIF